MVDNAREIIGNDILLENIDYKSVDTILEEEKKSSLEWLTTVLNKEKKENESKNTLLVKTLNKLHRLERENKKLKEI